MSQTGRVLAMLYNRPEGITAIDALDAAGCFRLAARINELRREGYDIETREERTSSGKRIARYVLTPRTLWVES